MLLFYDSKCSICRTLAYKLHFLTGKNLEIQSLYSPEAEETLSRYYPNGWEHDFYIVHNDSCRKGLRALPSLMRSVGFKRMASLASEYGSYKLAPTTCSHANGEGLVHPKRNFLKLAAMTPLLYGFSRVRLENPLDSEKPVEGFGIHVAEVEKVGPDEFQVRAYRCAKCHRPPVPEKGLPPGAAKRLLDRTTLAEDSIDGFSTKAQGLANFRIQRIEYERDLPKNGTLVTERRLIRSAMLDHPLYNLSVNISESGERMLAGMARHDLPIPMLDYVIFRPAVEEDAATHLAAYEAGLLELAKLHRREERKALAHTYAEMAKGFSELAQRFDNGKAELLWPAENEIIVTSMPELLRFVQRPDHLQKQEAVAGCDCSCSCAACCGCGCSLGICVEPFSPCGCDCCLACGCGCGCCL